MHISEPFIGRLSRQMNVQFSRPLIREGVFEGVVVASISPEYLSRSFREIFPDEADTVLLARDDGVYLARSHRFENIVGTAAPPTHAFMADRVSRSGLSTAVSVVDGVRRVYAFHRVAEYPLVVSLGLDADRSIAPVKQVLRSAKIENAAGTGLLLLAALAIAGLFAQRERSTASLADNRERLELALDGGELGTWDWHVPTGYTVFNLRWAEMLGYRPDEVAPDVSVWERLVHPDDKPVIASSLEPHLRGETPQYESEHRMRHRDGSWVWVLDRGRVTARSADGAALRMVGTHLDITARKLAEAAAAESADRLARLVAEVPGIVYQYLLRPDGSSVFPYTSPGIFGIYGISAEEAAISAEPALDLIHPGDLDRVSASIQESAERLAPWRCEYRICDAHGAVRWLLGHANPQRLDDGSTLWHGYIQDITEQHAAAEALQRSEERLRLTIEGVRDGVWEWEVVTGAMRWDARCFEMLGYADGAIDISFDGLVAMLHPSDREHFIGYIQAHCTQRAAQVASFAFRMQTAAEKWLWIEGRGRIVAWEEGLPARMVGTFTDISARVQETQLRDALLERSSAAIFTATRKKRRMLSANARTRELFGHPGEDMNGFDLQRLHVDQEHFDAFSAYYEALRVVGRVRFEYPLRDVNGNVRWFDVCGVQQDPDQAESNIVWTLIDVTDRHLAEAELATERVRMITLLERFPGGVLMEDAEDTVVVANRGLCDLFGLAVDADALIGLSHAVLCDLLGEERQAWLHEPRKGLGAEQRRSIEVVTDKGRTLEIDWVKISNAGKSLGRVWLVRDISERKQREATLVAMASTDALTGLPNRRSFMARLERALDDVRQGTVQMGVVLMLDIDHFKRVNDTWGHAIGDVVLQHVAEIIRGSLRQGDVAGRIGGEEFAALLPATSVEDGRALAERLREKLAVSPAQTDAGSISVTISIGLASVEGSDAKRVLADADEALYAAKAGGRNRVCVATSDSE